MKRKLYRDDINGKFLGVCSGLGEYFGIDPTIVRVVWAFAFFLYGAGFWVYIVLAIALPKKSRVMSNDPPPYEPERDFDTRAGQDVDARPYEGDARGDDRNANKTSEQYDEEDYWKESRKNSDGEWK